MKEKHYQRAISKLFKEKGINFQEQFAIPIKLKEKEVGKYFFDFLVEDKVVLEIKVGRLKRTYFDQLHSYVKASGKKLGILAIFTENEVKFRRILNLY
ncbi:MAG: GxxExxY protein [Patescibacteria group bacterium]|nr:GxxExxY protein [Patescibacteria group bacterium]